MTDIIAGIAIPETSAAAEATRLVEATTTPLLFHHSRRVFLFSSIHAQTLNLDADPELLYMASLFHDTGLVPPFSEPEQRFEVDGADNARAFLLEHGFSLSAAETVWQAIALHTTPGIPPRMGPEIAATHLGVLTDVLGFALDDLDPALIEEVTAAHPRGDFKNGFLQAFHDGLKHRPDTTYGTVNADVLEHFVPGFRRGSMVERITGSAWAA
ncbi:HD domain-containing protein [Streptomyces sp. NPDC005708]|uniref:HD domain-containing protein n=1 Tax=Streptomyces sp. NPDC005708 TaxID=3154564 RepID=UPI0033F8A238